MEIRDSRPVNYRWHIMMMMMMKLPLNVADSMLTPYLLLTLMTDVWYGIMDILTVRMAAYQWTCAPWWWGSYTTYTGSKDYRRPPGLICDCHVHSPISNNDHWHCSMSTGCNLSQRKSCLLKQYLTISMLIWKECKECKDCHDQLGFTSLPNIDDVVDYWTQVSTIIITDHIPNKIIKLMPYQKPLVNGVLESSIRRRNHVWKQYKRFCVH